MDKTALEEYDALVMEQLDISKRITKIKRKLRELAGTVVADSVEGTREDGTYGPIKIKGLPLPAYDQEARRLRKQETRYKILQLEISAQTEAIEEFIETVESPQIRTILRMRYIDRAPWEKISRRFGKSRDWARLTVDNFLNKPA